MKVFHSCKEAIAESVSRKYFAMSHLYSDEKTMDMHIHDCYEVYYSISGGKQFLIDNQFYDIAPGDVFFINQFESHHLTQIDSQTHERIVFCIHPDFLKSLCTENTDLDACFREHALRGCHRVSLGPEEQKQFFSYVDALEGIDGYGSDLLALSTFLALMVFLCRRFRKLPERAEERALGENPRIGEILSYIDRHIGETIRLEEIAAHFYLSPSYLCRIFKSATGTTVGKYIAAKRIARAKELLARGKSVSETSERCGFNDYSNFYKAFTRAAGVSPKKYSRLMAGQARSG